jgi:Zn-dependent protease
LQFFATPEAAVTAIIVLGVLILVAFPVHEFAHAYAAYRLGDSTARLFGRLTLNPAAPFDPAGGLILALSIILSGGAYGFGWAKPTPVNPANLRGGQRGDALVALAGPLANLLLAAAAALVFRLLDVTGASLPSLAVEVLFRFFFINLVLMVFNLIPIPPLDGSHVLFALLEPRASWQARAFLSQYGTIILMVVIFLPIIPPGRTVIQVVFEVILPPLIQILLGS